MSEPVDLGHEPPPHGRLGSRYWRLLTATGISSLGDGIDQAGLPLLVTTITVNPTLVAGMQVFFTLPWLLFSLPTGALVDRWDRKQAIWRSNVIRGVLVAVIAVLAMTGTTQIWHLYVLALLLGLFETIVNNAAQAMVPSVVEPALLEKANGREYAVETVGNAFVGPPIGGVLFALAVSMPFWLDSASFFIAAALVATLAGRYRPAQRPVEPGERRTLRADIAEGVRWLRAHRLLRTLALTLMMANFCNSMAMATLVLLATEHFGLSAGGFGLMLTTFAVGAVTASLLADRIVGWVGAGRLLMASALGFGLVAPLTVALAPSVWIATIALAVEGASSILWNVITVSLRQQLVPAELFGRVNSVYRFLGLGAMPIGALVGGVVASAFGLVAPWYVAAAVFTLALALAVTLGGLTPRAVDEARAGAVAARA